jgi:hypothetical protein
MSILNYLDSNDHEHARMMAFIVPGGKNKGKSAVELYDNDQNYCEWCKMNFNTSWGIQFNQIIMSLSKIKYLIESQKIEPRFVEKFPFGQYKGVTLAHVLVKDPDYCNWVMGNFPFDSYKAWVNVKFSLGQLMSPTVPTTLIIKEPSVDTVEKLMSPSIPVIQTLTIKKSSDKEPEKNSVLKDSAAIGTDLYDLINAMSLDERTTISRVILENSSCVAHAKLAYYIRDMTDV